MRNNQESKVMFDVEEVRDMVGIFEEYQDAYVQADPNYSIQSLTNRFNQNPTDRVVEEIAAHDRQTRKFICDVVGKSIFLLNQLIKECLLTKQQVSQLNGQLSDKQSDIESYKEKIAIVEMNLSEMVMMYEKVKIQSGQLIEKITQQQQQFKEQSQTLHRTFTETQEENKADKKILSELYDNNEQLLKTINQTKNQKSIIQTSYKKVTQQHENCQYIIGRLKDKIEELQARVHDRMEQELQYLATEKQQIKEESSFRESFGDILDEKVKKKTKLSDQVINYRLSGDVGNSFLRFGLAKSSHESFSQVLPEEQSVYERKVSIDPYYSHYILTSQSVKIKQDCEDMLNIDMKPYYKQIIEKRIPMHLWDQWVKNRLRQLIKINI